MEDERFEALYVAVELWARELVIAVVCRELPQLLVDADAFEVSRGQLNVMVTGAVGVT